MEEEGKTTTAAFKSMLQRSGGLNAIYEEEDKLSVIVILLIHNRTADYNSDTNEIVGSERQGDHEMAQNRLQRVQRGHSTHQAV